MTARRGPRWLRVLCWAGLAGGGASAGVRFAAPDRSPLLIGVAAIAVIALLPTLVVLPVAVWRRWTATAIAAAVGCVLAVTGAAQEWGWSGSGATGDGPHVRVVSANVLLDNPRPADLADALSAEHPDLVVLQEVTPRILAALESTALWSALPHHLVDARAGYQGAVVLSRWRIDGGSLDAAGTAFPMASIDVEGVRVRVVDVHTRAPLSEEAAGDWTRQFRALGRWVNDTPGPVVLAGDHNATPAHAPFSALLRVGGLTDAFSAAGTGPGWTYPQAFPVMRLDHVLVGGGIGVRAARTAHSPGSDHRHLVVDLVLPGAR